MRSRADAARNQRRRIVSAAGAVAFAFAAAYAVVFFNPFDWGILQSKNFSWTRFERIQPGDRISDVVADLGEPIRAPEQLEIIDSGDQARKDPCFPRKCRTWRFLGSSGGRWPVRYEEAIVVVGHDGRVVFTQRREE